MALDRYILLNSLIKWCFILLKTALDNHCYSNITCARISGSISLNVSSNRTLKLFSQSCVSVVIASRDFAGNVCLAEANVMRRTADFATELSEAFLLVHVWGQESSSAAHRLRNLTAFTTQWSVYLLPVQRLTNCICMVSYATGNK